jgi:hypothetical protein
MSILTRPNLHLHTCCTLANSLMESEERAEVRAEQIRARETERTGRLLNEKMRTIGLDIEGLEAQLAEGRGRREDERNRIQREIQNLREEIEKADEFEKLIKIEIIDNQGKYSEELSHQIDEYNAKYRQRDLREYPVYSPGSMMDGIGQGEIGKII